jgi:hypothetical protein
MANEINDPTGDDYIAWLKLREETKDDDGDKLCYCGHTYKCHCGDPDFDTFFRAVKCGFIILKDPDNGWKHVSG